jgi:hypothetical protein
VGGGDGVGNHEDACNYGRRIFTHYGDQFAKCQKIGKGYGGTLGDEFFSLFSQKLWMEKGYEALLRCSDYGLD